MIKLKGQNNKGFTLIELMIVIAIIGILAAIAVPNFLAYRNKAYCSGAETDANNIAAGLSDYFAIPTHLSLATGAVPTADLTISLTRNNSATISGNLNAIVITVTDNSGRCPNEYMISQPGWTVATSIFTKTMN